MLRNCYVCKQSKPISEFYFQGPPYNRPQSRCKLCNNIRSNKRLQKLPSEKRRSLWRAAIGKSQEKNKVHVEARQQVKKALKMGILTKQSCEKCKDPKTQAHHDDYSKPLSVRWLCHNHHRDAHYGGRRLKVLITKTKLS